jgi:hypothetical protein
MKSKIIIYLFSCFLFTGCSENKYKQWNVSKFVINADALKDKEELKLIYSSSSPNTNNEAYTHLIVVSQLTGDTVNILTSINNAFESSDGDRIFNYLSPDNFATKVSQVDLSNLKIEEIVEKAKNNKSKKLLKVWRDPKFDNLSDNSHPTVFGIVATITEN